METHMFLATIAGCKATASDNRKTALGRREEKLQKLSWMGPNWVGPGVLVETALRIAASIILLFWACVKGF